MTTTQAPAKPRTAMTLNKGLEDGESVTVAFLVAVGSAESGRETLMFLTKEATRLVTKDVGRAVACEGCPSLESLLERYAAAGGRFLVCPICFNARHLYDGDLPANAELGGSVQLWEWIGDEPVNSFSY